jgi:predicted  nucleic acid-binding Zn-ribbon protein
MTTEALLLTLKEATKQTAALGRHIRDLEKHIADLESEPEMDKKAIAELHQENERLEKRMEALEPKAIAARFHDFLFHRELVETPWKVASSEWRRDLIAAAEEILQCTDE